VEQSALFSFSLFLQHQNQSLMAYRIVVDFDLCDSNGVCMDIAPEVFEVRDDGFVYILQEVVDGELLGKAAEAVPRCPTQAISLEEVEEG
jgi:ferredoxin